MTAWRKTYNAQKKNGVPKSQRVKKPAANSERYPTKAQIALNLIADFTIAFPQIKLQCILADALYGSSKFFCKACAQWEVIASYEVMTDYGFNHEDIIRIANYNYGYESLQSTLIAYPLLKESPYNLTPEQMSLLICNGSAKSKIEAYKKYAQSLLTTSNLNSRELIYLIGRKASTKPLEYIVQYLETLNWLGVKSVSIPPMIINRPKRDLLATIHDRFMKACRMSPEMEHTVKNIPVKQLFQTSRSFKEFTSKIVNKLDSICGLKRPQTHAENNSNKRQRISQTNDGPSEDKIIQPLPISLWTEDKASYRELKLANVSFFAHDSLPRKSVHSDEPSELDSIIQPLPEW